MAGPFLFIGDSLIQYFDWQERFPDREIYNYGIAGETAEGLLARLPSITGRVPSPDLVLIMTGINNVAMEDYGFLFTYDKIITRLLQAYARASIVISSLLPADLYFLGEAVPRVNEIMKNTAERHNVIYLDLYPLFIDKDLHPVPSLFEADGIHLSSKGYEVWARALENIIFPDLV